MLPYCLNYRKNTESKNSTLANTKSRPRSRAK